MVRRVGRIGITTAVSFLVMALAGPASATTPRIEAAATAPTPTTLAVSGITNTGTALSVTGTLTLGTDALAPILVSDDAQGDDSASGAVPDGLDLGKSTIQYDPAGGKLVFTIGVLNPPPGGLSGTPFFVYNWQIATDEVDSGQFLSAGNIGTNFPPRTSTGFALCTNAAAGWTCTKPLTGTWGSGSIAIQVPLTKIAARPGSVISPGASLNAPAIAATFNPSVELFYDTGGDDADASEFQIPGGLQIGIAPAGTPETAVNYTVSAAFAPQTGAFAASLPKPATAGSYTVFVKSCYGSLDAPACLVATGNITI